MEIVDIEYLLIFSLFTFCFYFSIKEEKSNVLSIVHPHTSIFLKAFCCLVIIVHHYALRKEGGIVNHVFEIGGGTYALVIFLFLSSYGIVKSEIKHETKWNEYFRHRLWKLLLPYLFVTLISIGVYDLIGAHANVEELRSARISPAFVAFYGGDVTFVDILGYVLGYKSFSSSMWFVGVTVCSYVAFGISKWLVTKDCKYNFLEKRHRILLVYTLSLCAFAIFTYINPKEFPAHYYRNLWALWLGMVAALYEKEILSRSIMVKASLYLLMNVLMLGWLTLTSSGDKMYYIFANVAIVSIMLGNTVFRNYCLKPNSLICHLSLLSYCVYLIHGKVLTIEWWYMGYNSVILVVAICIVLSYFTNKLMNYVLRK